MRKAIPGTLVVLLLGIGCTLVFLLALEGTTEVPVYAQGFDGIGTYYVAPGGNCGTGISPCYDSIQAAVDAADDPNDVIKVAAGQYTDIHTRPRNDVSSNGTVTQIVYISKTVTIQGGYTTADWTVSEPDMNSTTLDAQGQGRVLYITGNISPTIAGFVIEGGDATGLGGIEYAERDAGGGIYIITATVLISDNLVRNNTSGDGGGLYLHFSSSTLQGNTVITNTAVSTDPWSSGGGIYLYGSDVLLTGNTIAENTSVGDGGGLGAIGGYVVLISNTIRDNTASQNGGGGDFLLVDPLLDRNTIISNTARGGGGLWLSSSDATLNDNVIAGNTATDGDGGGIELHYCGATLVGNSVSKNNASNYGGGLHIYESQVSSTLARNSFKENIASIGGGIAVYDSGAHLMGNLIWANKTAHGGSGLLLDSSTATLGNNVIADNVITRTSDGEGAGVRLSGSSATFEHNTLARNTGGYYGSGIYLDSDWDGIDSTAHFTNTILVSHTVGIRVADGSVAVLEATLWGSGVWANDWDYFQNWSTGEYLTGTVNLWEEPAFVDPEKGNYHIGLLSAALDQGKPTALFEDIDGDPRSLGQKSDIGADEVGVVLTQQPTPLPLQGGAQVTYTILLTNATDVDLQTTITDVLPSQVTPTGSRVLTTGVIPPRGTWTEQILVTIQADYAGELVNVLQATTDRGITATHTSVVNVAEQIIVVSPSAEAVILASSADGVSTTIEFPAGCVTQSTSVAYLAIFSVNTLPTGLRFGGRGFVLEGYRNGQLLRSLVLVKPVTVTIQYTDDDMTGLDESTIELRYWNGHSWSLEGISVTGHDIEANELVASVQHLSEFAIFAQFKNRIYLPVVLRSY
jgi:parallel beta-helix repeat protein